MRAHGVQRAPVRCGDVRDAGRARSRDVRGGVPARAVRPARRLCQRVHPADQPRRAARGAQRDGVPAGRRPLGRRRRSHQALRHQSYRGARGVPRGACHAQDGLCRACDGRDRRWLSGTATKRALRRSSSDRGLAMDLADLAVLPAVFRRGGALPHHHRDQDDRHVLVRPLPPHHVRHRVGRRADRGRGRARRLRALSGACATIWAATRSPCASWTWAPLGRAG